MSELTLDYLIAQFKEFPFSEHAHAIGHLCIQWSFLENSLGLMLAILAGLKDPQTRPAIIHNTNMRDKVQMLKSVGFLVRHNDDWYERLRSVLIKIDDDLRNDRNRMIHDQWTSDREDVVRVTQMAKIIKEQARQYAFRTHDPMPISENEAWELVVTVSAQIGYVHELLGEWLKAGHASSE